MRNEKIALITGGGTGIGRAAALALAQAGYDVVLAGRRPEPIGSVAEEARKVGVRALAHPTDVANPASVRELFARTKEHFGRLDLLFNNAGVGYPAVPFEEIPFEEWQKVIDANLTGMFLCTQEAFKIMKSQAPRGGRIINNGSLSARVPRPLSAPYTASKHAVSGLTKACSLDGRPYDIAVGQIDIGNAATEMTNYISQSALQADGSEQVEPRIDVRYVAEAIVQMASLPLDANVFEMTIMATKMPFVGRG